MIKLDLKQDAMLCSGHAAGRRLPRAAAPLPRHDGGGHCNAAGRDRCGVDEAGRAGLPAENHEHELICTEAAPTFAAPADAGHSWRIVRLVWLEGSNTMTRLKTPLGIIIAALIVCACGKSEAPPAAAAAAPEPAATGQEAGNITARSLLDQALAEARRWQADAQLIGVTTSLADGPAHGFWFYDLQSPSRGTCTRIRAMGNGSVNNVGTGEECVLMKPVSEGFVDSPAAYEAALAAGFQKGDSVQFGLRYQRDQALATARECWVVWSDLDGDDEKGIIRGWCIDPATGTFVTRLSGYGRTEPLQ
jgi:hypothetical protein